MGWTDRLRRLDRRTAFETFEQRMVMSADPIASIPIEHMVDEQIDLQAGQELETALADAHNQTGLTTVRHDYGFQGSGQTVAIIDSGIAWDHFALGGGLGENYRVVGGWDFTEGDADPFDDGPWGGHGTHVAGIVGAEAGANSGVAPDVDLVGLRVFDDDGAGYFSWVEQALDWVHEHRNDFANPITTVNLSLGTDWNSDSVPGWAMLEDEFAQLEADGIFISVAAGNSFTDYSAPGLSYPAASSHVVPVSSVDSSGNFSYFSQRHERAIAAPGQWITSTVPDYVGNQNGINDDFDSYSGTSMAAPYVAGASVLVREAMEFVGYAGVTQDAIYGTMRDTADDFFDSATSAWYKRLNLQAAIDAIMPADDFGSTVDTAYGLGTLDDTASIDGLIGRLGDVDYFSFTAAASGTVGLTATTTHGMAAQWSLEGGGGEVGGDSGELFSFDVVAGNSYTVGLAGDNRLGYYTLDVELDETFTYTDWGAVDAADMDALDHSSSDTWYRFEAARNGLVTIEAAFSHAAGNVDLALYDSGMGMLGQSTGTGNNERIDVQAAAGDVFFLRAMGENQDVHVGLANLVSVDGSNVTVHGTDGNDDFRFTAGSTHRLTINGMNYEFNGATVTNVEFNGGAGQDSVRITGTNGNDQAVLRVGTVELTSSNYQISATSAETIKVYSGGGKDTAGLYDSAGDDTFRGTPTHSSLTGAGYENYVNGFDDVQVFASGGFDRAFFHDSAGDDSFRASGTHASMQGSGFSNYASGFDRYLAYAGDGFDRAFLYDSAGDNEFRGNRDYSSLVGDGLYSFAQGFDRVLAYASQGNDRAYLYDTAGDDIFRGTDGYATLHGDGYFNYAHGFDRVNAYASSGNDRAFLYDSAGDDVFRGTSRYGSLHGDGFYNHAVGFDRVLAYASTGDDRAFLYDSSGDDEYRSDSNYAALFGSHFYNYAAGFDRVLAFASAGNDRAFMFDSAGDDVFRSSRLHTTFYGDDFFNYVRGFDRVSAYSTLGHDRAELYDSEGNDRLTLNPDAASIERETYFSEARDFDQVAAYALLGGDDTAVINAVDYLYSLGGDWD